MDADAARRMPLPPLVAVVVAGSVLAVWTFTLPWDDHDFALPWPVRAVMALAGVAVLALTARAKRSRVAVGVAVLGTLTLLYPSLLGLGAAYPSEPAAVVLVAIGHMPPIVLMQLLPVIASSAAARRAGARREAIVVASIALALTASAVGLLDIPGGEVIATVGSILWFSQLAVAPVLTWLTVRGIAGEDRRRAVLAVLAASVPVLLIVSCSLLGAAAEGLSFGVDVSVALLMIGFSAAALACGALVLASRAPSGSRLLRASTTVRVLDAVLAAVGGVVVFAAALLARVLELPSAAAVAVGVLVAAGVALLWRASRRVTARIVDPASALRHELRAAQGIEEGQHRRLALRALRRAVDDPTLGIRFRVGPEAWPEAWVDESGADAERGDLVVARRESGEPVITVVAAPAAVGRVVALGDCSALLAPAAFEAQLAHESRRADRAAQAERRRLQQNLHDGLQGRLLGLALGLQLSGRELDDPGARLLVDETVGSLRSMVDEVRALGGGELPEVLQTEGLGPALHVLLGPKVGSLVELELPTGRLGAELEATAYFVIGEAVANALKHADADRIAVRVSSPVADRVTVTVQDDGCGGADPRAGTGLRALAERVTASGGEFLVRDDLRRGTVVEAVLPCGS